MFDEDWTHAGVACGDHSKFGSVCCISYGSDVNDLGQDTSVKTDREDRMKTSEKALTNELPQSNSSDYSLMSNEVFEILRNSREK
jgi:hypothetical protein